MSIINAFQFYKSEDSLNFHNGIKSLILNDVVNDDLEPDSENESIIESKNKIILLFSSLISELKNNPNIFTLIKINKYIKNPEIQDCLMMIDDQVIDALFALASPDESDGNIRQNSFFVIGSIIQCFPQIISMLFNHEIISLLLDSLSNPSDLFVSSIYFVINCLINESSYFRQNFDEFFEFDYIFQNAYKFIHSQNNDKIVECFKSIAEHVCICNKEEYQKLIQLFSLALTKRLLPNKDRIEMNSYHFALLGIIYFLNSQDIPSDIKKDVIEGSNVSVFIPFFFECNELSAVLINATVLLSQLYSLDISNIPDVFPLILKQFQRNSLDPNYHRIIKCLDIIIQVCNMDVFQKLIEEYNLIDIIFDLMSESNILTKIEIYSCFNSILTKIPKEEYVRIINDSFIEFLFDLINLDKPKFIEEVIEDIYKIFCVAEEIEEFETIYSVLESISAPELIEYIFEKNEVSEKSLGYLHYIYDKFRDEEIVYNQ